MIPRIYIDPGHSSVDPGAVGYEVERDLNEKVSKFQNEHLLANYKCETKVGDISINSVRKVAEEANAWGADFLCSNHNNAGGGDGYEALVYSSARVELGRIFEKHVLAIGQNSRGVKLRPDLGVLRLSNMPAILNEGAFVDNLKDIQDWNDDAELKKLGIAYAEATAEYLKLEKKVANPVKDETTTEPVSKEPTVEKLTVDGQWGKLTTTATQKVLGTPVDGIVSNQARFYKKYVPAALTSSWEFKDSGYSVGSALIRAIQTLVGATADGLCGNRTVTAIQNFLKKNGYYNYEVDGYMGEKTVRGWQQYINSRL